MIQHPFISSFPRRFSTLTALVCLALAPAGTGCRSTGESGSTGFASVTIHNHSQEEIVAVTAQVFGADGYRGARTGPGKMVLEKAASVGTTISRDGLLAAQSGARTINRVRVEILSLGGGTHRLECQAFVVTGGSDPFFQDEVALSKMRSGPYQSLLNQVAAQLK